MTAIFPVEELVASRLAVIPLPGEKDSAKTTGKYNNAAISHALQNKSRTMIFVP